jgi:hypothetical protein
MKQPNQVLQTERWLGSSVVEGNPLAFPLVACGPYGFIGLASAWGLLVALVLAWWRHWASDCLALLFTFGHAIGGSTWLVRFGPWGWVAATVYLAATADFTRWSWRRVRGSAGPPRR